MLVGPAMRAIGAWEGRERTPCVHNEVKALGWGANTNVRRKVPKRVKLCEAKFQPRTVSSQSQPARRLRARAARKRQEDAGRRLQRRRTTHVAFQLMAGKVC